MPDEEDHPAVDPQEEEEDLSRKKSLSSHLSRHDLEGEEFIAAALEMHRGSDRVAAILGSAMVEDSLLKVIKASLDDPSDESALFYDQGAPFGSFRSRIVAGKALGLFSHKAAADMDLIRDIRNQFAHALLSIDFSNPHIAKACNAITDYRTPDPPGAARKISDARNRYEHACWKLQHVLLDKANALLDAQLRRAKTRVELAQAVASSLQCSTEDILDHLDPN